MRTARKLWVLLVTLGELCVLAAIGIGLAAVILPQWINYSKDYEPGLYKNRGLFQNCNGECFVAVF